MKRCPSCQRTYPDDAPAFCVNDGTRLVDEESSPAFDPQKTILASPPPAAPQPYSNPTPPIQPPSPPPQPAWPPPPPQQGQNWGGYYPPGQGYAPPPKGNGLSLGALILGCVSGVLGGILFIDYLGRVFGLSRSMAYPMLIAAICTGIIAIVLGLIALFSSRQRSKGLAVVGMVLAAFSLGFWIYLEVEYHILFR